jgi:hypothetical protein
MFRPPHLIDGPNSISSRIVSALGVGADRDTIHDILVTEEQLCTEEDFFLAFKVAEIRFADLEAAASTRR